MEESKSLDHHNENSDKNINKKTLEIKNQENDSISNINNKLNKNKDLKININENRINNEINKIVEDKALGDIDKEKSTDKLNTNNDKTINNIDKSNNKFIQEKTSEVNKLTVSKPNTEINIDKSTKVADKGNKEVLIEKNLLENKKVVLNAEANVNADKNNPKVTTTSVPVKAKTKPIKEPPVEKKPFLEFVNDYLIPEIKNEFRLKGKEVNKISIQKTNRPIAEDICWVIYCEINDTCNFWLSFERDDITSLKSFSLCKNYEKPSIIESFLIDEKKITLKLIISRILQRLNGQKLIGAN